MSLPVVDDPLLGRRGVGRGGGIGGGAISLQLIDGEVLTDWDGYSGLGAMSCKRLMYNAQTRLRRPGDATQLMFSADDAATAPRAVTAVLSAWMAASIPASSFPVRTAPGDMGDDSRSRALAAEAKQIMLMALCTSMRISLSGVPILDAGSTSGGGVNSR